MSGDNYYRDADGNIIGPDVFIDGEPYEGTPLRSYEGLLVENRALLAENQQLREALRYICGEDVAGYDAHMRPEEVAGAALARLDLAARVEKSE